MTYKTIEIAQNAYDKHTSITQLDNYSGIISLYGLARLWLWNRSDSLWDKLQKDMKPFVDGKITREMGAFKLYNIGGSAIALLLRNGFFADSAPLVMEKANDLIENCPRSEEGIFSSQFWPASQSWRIWIDVAAAVSPFLVHAGVYFERKDWVEEAVEQTLKMIEIFRDQENGLCHQSRGFCGEWQKEEDPMRFSEDHWSRGNGWGIFALTELVRGLPQNHERRNEIEKVFIDLLEACLNFQDENGMWHQEMTDFGSYVETSGSGKILYALGVALQYKLVPTNYIERLKQGLEGYLTYISSDGSIKNTCTGVISPGMGTKAEYAAHPYETNNCHGFGPAILAFGQAAELGITSI